MHRETLKQLSILTYTGFIRLENKYFVEYCPLIRIFLITDVHYCYYYYYYYISLSPLCTVATHIFLRQTMSLGDTLLQLFSLCCLWCLYV